MAPVIVLATFLVLASFVTTVVCTIKHRSYRLVLTTGVLQIFTGKDTNAFFGKNILENDISIRYGVITLFGDVRS